MKFMIDGHLDLGMNAIEWNRDLTKTVDEIRVIERNLSDKLDRGKGTVSLPVLREGNIGLVVATQIARYVTPESTLPGYNSPEIAWGITQAQLAWYRAMEGLGEMFQINDRVGLESHIDLWLNDLSDKYSKPIGYILSLEGADSLVNISYLEKSYANGLRVCGPAHYGPGRYAAGTGEKDGFTKLGKELLREMDALDMILDITHLTDKGFTEALELYKGAVWASHHNCRTHVCHQRQLSDDQLKMLIDRGAVIGGAFDAWMLVDNWKRGVDDPTVRKVYMELIIDHFDHICQLAGNVDHIAIGSDLDGAFGLEQSPCDLDTISDLQSLEKHLSERGYTHEDIEKIFYKNWLRFLRNAWKE